MTSSHLPGGAESVPIENVRCGDPITDIDGHHYKVLEHTSLAGGGVVLELQCKEHNEFRVIEKSFPAGYTVNRSPRRIV